VKSPKEESIAYIMVAVLSDQGIRTSPLHGFWTVGTPVYIIDVHPDDYGAFNEKTGISIKRK